MTYERKMTSAERVEFYQIEQQLAQLETRMNNLSKRMFKFRPVYSYYVDLSLEALSGTLKRLNDVRRYFNDVGGAK